MKYLITESQLKKLRKYMKTFVNEKYYPDEDPKLSRDISFEKEIKVTIGIDNGEKYRFSSENGGITIDATALIYRKDDEEGDVEYAKLKGIYDNLGNDKTPKDKQIINTISNFVKNPENLKTLIYDLAYNDMDDFRSNQDIQDEYEYFLTIDDFYKGFI